MYLPDSGWSQSWHEIQIPLTSNSWGKVIHHSEHLVVFIFYFFVKVSNNVDFVLTVTFMNKVLKLGKLRISSDVEKRDTSQINIFPVKLPHLYIFSQISSEWKLCVLQKWNYWLIILILYSYSATHLFFSFIFSLHRSKCLGMIWVLIFTIKTFHWMRPVSTTFRFSLRAAALTSETSAGKLRLGIDLVSSGRGPGWAAQPAVLLLPFDGNLWLGESSAEHTNADDPVSYSVSRCCCSGQRVRNKLSSPPVEPDPQHTTEINHFCTSGVSLHFANCHLL